MKKYNWLIKVGFIFILISFGSQIILATDLPTFELPPLLVTAKKALYPINRIPANVTVLTSKQLAASSAQDIAEALEKTTGIAIDKSGGTGRAVSVSIQGSQARHVRVMVDGIIYNNQASGESNLSQIPLEIIDRIEIIKGPSSSVWGSGLGGVINIITKAASNKLEGFIQGLYGQYNTKGASFNLSGQTDPVNYFFGGDLNESDGFRTKGEIDSKKIFAKFSVNNPAPTKVSTSIGYNQGHTNDFENTDWGIWQAQDYKVTYSSFNLKNSELKNIDLSANIKYSDLDVISYVYLLADDSEANKVTTNDKFYGLELLADLKLAADTNIIIGSDILSSRLDSSYLSEIRGGNNIALFTNINKAFLDGEVSVGARYDYSSEFGYQLSPSLGSVLPIPYLADTIFRVNVEQSFNTPPLLWKYLEGAYQTGNPDLKPERAWVIETGVETELVSNTWGKINLYHAKITDAIARATNDEGKQYQKNFKSFVRQGIEAEVKYLVFKATTLFVGANFNDVRNSETSEIVEDRPRFTSDFGVSFQPKDLGFALDLTGHSIWWKAPLSYGANDNKVIWDVKLTKNIDQNLGAFLYVYNIFNTANWHYETNPLPLRHFEGGIKWRF
jgi:vitamin B12 transporter